MPLPAAALTAGAFVRANWRLFAVAAIAATAWWWHASEVRAAAQAAEKTTHAHYAGVLANISNLTAEAERKTRAAEHAVTHAFEVITDDGQKRIDTARADAAGARAAAGRLQQQLAHYRGAAAQRAAHPGLATAGPAAGDALDLLAHLFSRAEDRARELAAFADLAHAAGITCERAYDTLERELNSLRHTTTEPPQ